MFELNKEQIKKAAKWVNQQDRVAAKMQKLANGNEPYYGAIGGELTYSFTITSLGVIAKIKHGYTGNEIDLTEYDLW